ncbi:hypothetical protein L7F22_026932 [Adiantum nelumboides]|nr:hypothetical protein [Adiantum nelumboides]
MATAPIYAPQVVESAKVTDSQVAFMVECYLRDSQFSRTLEEFRSEAARLLHPLRAVPKGARSLSAVLNDYVALKEVQISAAAEKARVEDLFQGLQEILTVYLAGAPKRNDPLAESGSGRTTSTVSSFPNVTPSAATTQQPQLRGSTASEAGNAFVSTDQNSKLKPSTSKRKSLDNTNHESLQQGDSTVDPAKKSRRGCNVKRAFSDPSSTENSVHVDSPTASMGSVINKAVQPATPPMSLFTSSKLQQPLPSHASSGSPRPSSLPTATRSSLVSPREGFDMPITSPSLMGNCTQNHQDPQTPPPSSMKFILGSNGMPTPIDANLKGETGTTTVQGKATELQRSKASLPHLPSSTCPYALRAHRRPGSEPPSAALSDAKVNCTQKAARKKASNSKCRLLDFSSAAEDANKIVPPLNAPLNQGNNVNILPSVELPSTNQKACGSNRVGVSPSGGEVLTNNMIPGSNGIEVFSSGVEALINPQQTCGSSTEVLVKQELVQGFDSSPSTQSSQDSQASDFALPCDTFSFDELFDLDLDTSLISELEDLAALTGSDEGAPSYLKTSDMGACPLVSDPSVRGILEDVGNHIHTEDATSLGPQCANPLASPSKLRKLARGNGLDKENMHADVVLSSPQITSTKSPAPHN